MKKLYLTPKVREVEAYLEEYFLASGEKPDKHRYGDDEGEDDSCFWE